MTSRCYCPACARPFVSRKVLGGNNRTPAHNIISRDALKLTGAIKDYYGEKVLGNKMATEVGGYGNTLLVFFLLHFDGLMTSGAVPLYHAPEAPLWTAVKDFLQKDGGRAFLFSAGAAHPFGLGNGDRYDKDFSHQGLLDRLFGVLAKTKSRRREPPQADWDFTASTVQKAKTLYKALEGYSLAPKDSYTTNYCQTLLDAQCGTCESRQGEANLLCRYFAARNAIGQQNSAQVTLTATSGDLLNFIGLQFCCGAAGEPVTSVTDISEEWLTKVTVWQLYRHLESMRVTLKEKIFGNQRHTISRDGPIPVILETLLHNWNAFSLFYTLAYLRISAGDYDDATQLFSLGKLSAALETKLKTADTKAADEISQTNVALRRFAPRKDGGASIGGVACAWPVKKW
ncbi:hypothetical protein HMI49_25745 [Corallococcus exercitus]|uniref:Uncharacterized protein n=1 Tax=Corallococcus exercitus TaxID=2316736 RepID=A0A7Y4KMS2_9BACT|nr:hypothetical protein [Corallococcus exercitus]NOK36616.1 hypothetical protein [Corallococcus exercitus]